MTKWEYNVFSVPADNGKFFAEFQPEQMGKALDRLGADGWELVSVVVLTRDGHAKEIVATLKRPLTNS